MGKEGPAGSYGIKGAAGEFYSYHIGFLQLRFLIQFQDHRVHLEVMVYLEVI